MRYKELDEELAPLFDEVEGFGGDQLTETFGADSVVGVYATPDEQVRVAVTIYDGESGLFIQTGPPVPPEMSANSETVGEYVHQGDSVCFAQWQAQAKRRVGRRSRSSASSSSAAAPSTSTKRAGSTSSRRPTWRTTSPARPACASGQRWSKVSSPSRWSFCGLRIA